MEIRRTDNPEKEVLAPYTKEAEKLVAGVDFKKVISPISFVNDTLTNSCDVNSLFMSPYCSHNAMAMANKSELSENMQKNVDRNNKEAKNEAINSFFRMNVYTLTYDILVKFIQNAFADEIELRSTSDKYHATAIDIVSNYIKTINMDLESELQKVYGYPSILSGLYNLKPENTFDEVIALLTPRMDDVFTGAVEFVFNNAVNKLIDNTIKANNFETLFAVVFYSCYKQEVPEHALADMRTAVQFVGVYLRESLDMLLKHYRISLDLLTYSVAGMITGVQSI